MTWKRIALIFSIFILLTSCDLLPIGSSAPEASAPEEDTQSQPMAALPTETALPTDTPSPTATPEPSNTPVPAATDIPATAVPVDGPGGGDLEEVPVEEVPISYPFAIQVGSPIRILIWTDRLCRI